jgi:glycosyltransferase involved in cell wall biosynthesis
LRLKAGKKRTYLRAASALGLYEGVQWHAASAGEEADIRSVIGAAVTIHVAPNLPSLGVGAAAAREPKSAGRARFAAIARVVRMKNLIHALRALRPVRGQVELDAFGPMEDAVYWAECQRVIAELPRSIRVSYRGELAHSQVSPTLSKYEFFISPTLGENFGHAIWEGLACGCPVVISDRTQFRGLAEAGAGWDLALDDVAPWTAALQQCVDMSPEDYARSSVAAQRLAAALSGPAAAGQSVTMFRAALGEERARATVAGPVPAGHR